MGYRLEIVKNKKNERVEKQEVESMLDAVKVLNENLLEMLNEVNNRDAVVTQLELEIEGLKKVIEEQQERIDDRDKKIQRVEAESQQYYEEKCKLTEELEKAKSEKEKLQTKMDKLLDVFKD
jgi:chromosome segregation ATPase